MALFSIEGVTKQQKVVVGITGLAGIGCFFSAVTHNFVASPIALDLALYASLTLTGVITIFVIYWHARGEWKLAPAWHGFSEGRKVIVLLFAPLLLWGMLWLNMTTSIPQLFTLTFGDENSRQDLVIKQKSSSRRSCHYRLKPKSVETAFFHYCIPENLYKQLPMAEMEAELIIQESSLGYVVENIRLR